jgi:hypothetical protein
MEGLLSCSFLVRPVLQGLCDFWSALAVFEDVSQFFPRGLVD